MLPASASPSASSSIFTVRCTILFDSGSGVGPRWGVSEGTEGGGGGRLAGEGDSWGLGMGGWRDAGKGEGGWGRVGRLSWEEGE